MRLLHVITSLEIGGAQRLLSGLLPLQKSQGLDVTLLVYERVDNAFTKQIEEAGVPILSLDEHNFKSPKNIFRLRKVFKDYDIVHVHLFPSSYWSAFASIGLRKTKLVWTEHSTSNGRRGKWYFRLIEKFVYGRYKKLISISQQTQDALQDWLQSQDDRFVVINNGVDTKAFASIKRSIIPKSLIMVSRFASSKDQETVIRAMRLIDKEASLRFLGDGENLEHCKAVAKECGVEDIVQFLGARSDVAELIAESCIGIQSSNWEGFGLTAVELMSCGKPVIATNVDGLKHVVEGAGLIFNKKDTDTLAGLVNGLLQDDAYYQEISKKCKERASQYDISIMAEAYLIEYKIVYNRNIRSVSIYD